MAAWEVRSFHLNIDEGDCAVHYRVQKEAEKVLVDNAVLVDGGLKNNGSRVLKEFFEGLAQRTEVYFSTVRTIQQMDAVVVTHWDADHVDGLTGLFQADLKVSLERLRGQYPNATSQDVQTEIDTGAAVAPKASYCLYESNFPTTKLFAPYWNVSESKMTGSNKPVRTPSNDLETWINNSHKYVRVKVQQGSWTVWIPILVIGGVPGTNPTQNMLGRALLGRDLFTGEPVMEPDTARSPAHVSHFLSTNNIVKPVMFCIAADFGTCNASGEDARVKKMQWANPAPGNYTNLHLAPSANATISDPAQIDSLHETGPISTQAINGRTTGNNQASIACMIIWPSAGDARVSHYFAGDIGSKDSEYWGNTGKIDDIEERVLRWSCVPDPDKGNDNDPRTPIKISAMKLSHHGSKLSTPLRMLFAWRPSVIIASNGMSTTFNHVSWEILYLLIAYRRWMIKHSAADQLGPPELYCTNFPVYLVKYFGDKTNYVAKWALSTIFNSNGSAWRDLLDVMRTDVNLADLPIVTKSSSQDVKDEARRVICNYICTEWIKFCFISTERYWNGTSIDANMMHAAKQYVRVIEVGQTADTWITQIMDGQIIDMTELNFWDSDAEDENDDEYISDEEMGGTDLKASISRPTKRLDRHKKRRLSGSRQSIHTYTAKTPLNRQYIGNRMGSNRLKRPSRPMVTEKAFSILTMDKNINDDDDLNPDAIPRVDFDYDADFWDMVDDDIGVKVVDDLTYVKASDAKKTGNDKSVSEINLVKDSNGDYFLGHLQTGSMVLTSYPSGSPTWTPAHPSDELNRWLLQCLGNADDRSIGLSALLSKKSSEAVIEGLQFVTQLAMASSAPRTVVKASDEGLLNTTLVFDSNGNKHSFGLEDGIWPALPSSITSSPVDIFGPAQMVAMSIGKLEVDKSKIATIQMTGRQLLNFLNMRKSNPIQDLLADSIRLTLDLAAGQRNTIWYSPDGSDTTTLRLAFVPTAGDLVSPIKQYVGELIGNTSDFSNFVSLPKVGVIAKKVWTKCNANGKVLHKRNAELSVVADVSFGDQSIPAAKKDTVQMAIVFGRQHSRWILTFDPSGDGLKLSEILDILCTLFQIKDSRSKLDLDQYLPGASSLLIRRVTYTSIQKKKQPYKSLNISIQVTFANVIFLCSIHVSWGTKVNFSISGNIFPENRSKPGQELMTWIECMPDFEPWTSMLPKRRVGNTLTIAADAEVSDVGNLQDICHAIGQDKLPSAPFTFDLVGINFLVDRASVRFNAIVGGKKPDDSYKVPSIQLMTATLTFDYTFAKPAKLNELSIISSMMLTNPIAQESMIVNLDLGYFAADPRWRLSGGLTGTSGAFLYTLFDDDCNEEVIQLLKHVVLSLNLEYNYNSDGGASILRVTGLLHVGSFDFDFEYAHNGKKTPKTLDGDYVPSWTFKASLSSSAPENGTLLSILDSLCGGELSAALPEFLREIKVERNKDSALTSISIADTETALVFCMRFQLTDGSSVYFYQLQNKRKDKTSKDVPATKRILALSVDKLPSVKDIPVIGSLEQPFDEMQFFWASCSDQDVAGLTRADVELINSFLPKSASPLVFKDNAKAENSPSSLSITQREQESQDVNERLLEGDKGKDVVIATGYHLCILKERKTLLDYAFGGQKKDRDSTQADDSKPPPATAPINKKLGPVTITALGLSFDIGTQRLALSLSGTLRFGPLELTLIGFSISVAVKRLKKAPSEVDQAAFPGDPEFSLKGLALAFERAPVTLAGMFEYGDLGKGAYYYKGAAAVGFKPWLFEGGGYYGVSQKSTGDKLGSKKLTSGIETLIADNLDEEWAMIDPYLLEALLHADKQSQVNIFEDPAKFFTSFFAFVRVSGPIATIGYAEIRDVCGGFGYNTTIAFPTMKNILDFPFFKSPGDDGVASALTKFLDSGWVANSDGSNWVAAGLTVNAFQMLNVTAIIVVEFGSTVKLGIFGLATAIIPKVAGSEPPFKFAVVQLGVSATVDFDAGIMKIDGQLTPASYILDPSCHLTGGFALYTWFGEKTKALQGDWVFTIGGFHPSFDPPIQYPRPPRLGISWSFDSSINISGQAYFAITPKVCMGGGSLHVTLTLGALYAYFDAWADFLIKYKPFQYQASGGVSVGVRYVLDLWLVSIPINISLGASLYLQGPPLSGKVHVDFYVFGFDVNFGKQGALTQNTVGWKEFYALVLQAPDKTPAALSMWDEENTCDEFEAVDADLPVHVISCLSGLIPRDEKTAAEAGPSTWLIRGAIFNFSVTSKFAVNTAKVTTSGSDTVAVDNPTGKENKVYAKPMGLRSPLSNSELHITITRLSSAASDAEEFRITALDTSWKRNVGLTTQLPTALWGPYKSDSDPSGGNNKNPDLLNGQAGANVELMNGIQLAAPTGGRSEDKIVAFNVEKAMREVAQQQAFPQVQTTQESWGPAVKAPTSAQQIANVQSLWNKIDESFVGQAAQFWAQLDPGKANWDAVGLGKLKKPDKLVQSLDQYYVEAPYITIS